MGHTQAVYKTHGMQEEHTSISIYICSVCVCVHVHIHTYIHTQASLVAQW